MNNSYKCLSQQLIRHESYHVQPYRHEDIYVIKEWRNAQMDVLRQDRFLTDTDQDHYYKQVIVPSFDEPQTKIILFSFLHNNVAIGYGGLTNCSWQNKRSELSFLVDPERAANSQIYECDFSAFITMMKYVNFELINFNRLFTETYDIRPHHISIIEKNGFVLEGRMRQHTFIDDKPVDSLIHAIIKEDYV